MKLALDFRENLEKNAQNYFEKAKKAKKKLEGAREALEKTKKKLEKLELQETEAPKSIEDTKIRKKEWYEKYHWFISSDGLLVIGGRDATTNEIVIKKHTEKDDMVLHTDMRGSPFVVIKAKGEIPESTIKEAGEFVLAHSRAWKGGMGTAPVFYVAPDQVSKAAKSGEALPKGAFMIYGETNYVKDAVVNFAVGTYDKDGEEIIMGGPITAIKKNCKDFAEVIQGKEKKSVIAKKIRSKIGGDLDQIIGALPAGGVDLKK